MKSKRVCILLVVLLFLGILCGCEEKKIEPRGISYFDYFDTVSYIYSYTSDDEETFMKRADEVAGILDRYHQMFDIYHEYDGMNNLCTINRMAGKEPVEVSEDIVSFLLSGKELYYKTNGKMNIMIGALTRPWHEHRTAALEDPNGATLPDENELIEAKSHIDIESLIIDETNNTVYIDDEKALLDVGAYGKGYATERAADYLFSIEAYGYVLNIGGNIRTIGSKPDGTGWVTGITDPVNNDQYAMKINIADTACVTSGVYERYYMVDGVRYHHIIDPDTLYPAKYFDSVTVLCKDSGIADALSTALSCMSKEDGMKMLENFENVNVIWINPNSDIEYTTDVEKLLVK